MRRTSCLLLPFQATNRSMDSNPTPDRVEKATTMRRKPHSARGSHLLFLAFSTLGEFFAFFFFGASFHHR